MGNVDVSYDTSNKSNRKGIVALVLGILSIVTSFVAVGLVFGIVGLIYGVIALKEIKHFKQKRKGKVTTGIICCIFGIFLSLLFTFTAGMTLLN
ncbi:DUF4190 domain-containing protein [Virgibacillus sp. DJP39]|uniref:DUF4190 domain-containing protein n=1 Tax=Virgibacillus sp. DJP39 TaxID=3409790 RepID=UPI003BB792BA